MSCIYLAKELIASKSTKPGDPGYFFGTAHFSVKFQLNFGLIYKFNSFKFNVVKALLNKQEFNRQ